MLSNRCTNMKNSSPELRQKAMTDPLGRRYHFSASIREWRCRITAAGVCNHFSAFDSSDQGQEMANSYHVPDSTLRAIAGFLHSDSHTSSSRRPFSLF